jgi:hypothetical protein
MVEGWSPTQEDRGIPLHWGNTSSRVTSRHFKLSNWSLLNTDGPEWLFSMHHESLLTVPCSHFEVQKLLKVQS